MADAPLAAAMPPLPEEIAPQTGRRYRKRCILFFMVTALGALVAEGWAMWHLLGSEYGASWIGIVPPAVAHLVVLKILVTIAVYFHNRPEHCSRNMFMLLAVATAFMGVLGILGTVIAYLLHLEYNQESVSFEEWYASLFPEEERGASRELMERLQAAGEEGGSLTPFTDVLTYGTQAQKQAMIALISRDFRPQFAPVLNQALNDPDNAVRVQAATAATHVENRFMKKSMELEETVARNPKDDKQLLALARHCDDYAFSGLLEAERAREYGDKALAAYRKYLTLRPDDVAVRVAVGRHLVRSHRLEEAARYLEEALRGEKPSPQLALWYMETLYQLRRFEPLEELARRYGQDFTAAAGFPVQVVEAVGLWAGATRAATPQPAGYR
ncbi:MAG: hypothetical protein HQL82_01230 [Magnetococcales bacterium]|nr:hypothetical protein [Magnetococcales bacterium]